MHQHTNIKSNTDSGATTLDSPSVTRATLLSSDSSESPDHATLSSLLATRPLIRTFIPLFIALGLLSLAFLILTMSRTHAETATASVTVPVSCTMTASPSSEHTTTMNNGTYNEVAAETTLGAACNDNGGYSIYAVGYSDNASGNTNSTSMIGPSISGTSLTIPTCTLANCTSTTPDVSRWAMKLTSISGTSTPTILGDYDNYSSIPLGPTKVITYPAITATDNRSETKATYAVAISSTQPSGTYTGKVKYTIVHPNYANADGTITKGITFLTTNGATIAINGNTYANGASATLDAGTYTISGNYAEGFEFDSWSVEGGTLGSTSSDPTTLAFTGPVTVTLNSKSSCAPVGSLYCTIASMSKGKQTNDTNASTGIQAAITAPTSTDRTQDTSNSGVYEYDASLFGASSDASNDYPIYYYRGILEPEADQGSYGDGKATTYPNYVKLSNDTCWRILRTTGSGGVKLIYNGTYGATTAGSCANTGTNSELPTSKAFNSNAHTSGKSIVGVGYTYNTKYRYTTTATAAGTLFGTNDNYSDNTSPSTMKTYIEDTWYKSNMDSYTSMLEPSAGYCNDRSVNSGDSWTSYSDTTSITTPYTSASSGITIFYFGARMRNSSTYQKPSLTCPRNVVDLYTTSTASNGNKQLGYPVALATADEMSFAGVGNTTASYGSSCNAKSFANNGFGFSLLSPFNRNASGTANGYTTFATGYLSPYGVKLAYDVRPVISLKFGATPESGSGTATDPWVINP